MIVTDKIASMMSDADRKALKIALPAERREKAEAGVEKELQRLCEQELSRRGIMYLHLSFRAREKAGWPDLTFVIKGRPYAVELKTATGKLSGEQIDTMTIMTLNGWETRVCRSFEKFVEIITAENK